MHRLQQAPLAGAWSWRLTGSLGVSRIDVPTGSIFRAISPLLTTQAAVDVEGPVGAGADLRLSLVQPTTVERGWGDVVVPSGYDLASRRLTTASRRIGLAADERPLMLAATLSSRRRDGLPVAIGLTHRFGGGTSASLNANLTFE